jgi:hypothetical protein
VLKTVLRVLYLGEASSRANSNPAAGQLMALLGKTEPPASRGAADGVGGIRDIFGTDPDPRIRIPLTYGSCSSRQWLSRC